MIVNRLVFSTLIVALLLNLTGCVSRVSRSQSGYEVKKDGVYWREYSRLTNKYILRKVFNADKETFEQIKQTKRYKRGVAKDKRYVYQRGVPIPFADPDSFVVLSGDYFKDNNHVYYRGKPIFGLDSDEFQVLRTSSVRSYGKTATMGIYQDKIFELCEPLSYKPSLKYFGVWSLDDACVYYEGNKLIGIDRASFSILNRKFSKDKHHAYFENHRIEGADPKTFIALKHNATPGAIFAKDAMRCWNKDAEVVDCNTKRKKTQRMGAREFYNAFVKWAENFYSKSLRSKKEILRMHESVIAGILDKHGSKVLTPAKVASIDLNRLSPGDFVVLDSTVEPARGNNDRTVYLFKERQGERFNFDVFNTSMRGVLTEVRDNKGSVIQQANVSGFSPSYYSYTSNACRFEIGECVEVFLKNDMIRNTSSELSRDVKNVYDNGVWNRFIKNKQGDYVVKSKSIYDENGFAIYQITFSGDDLDNEYINFEYLNGQT